jgi:hypothetical protein
LQPKTSSILIEKKDYDSGGQGVSSFGAKNEVKDLRHGAGVPLKISPVSSLV